jgi:hypothetical protein
LNPDNPMKYILTLGLVLVSHFIFSQDIKSVEEALEKFRIAMLAEDHVSLKSLTSENLSYGHSSGLIENQEEFLKVFESKSQDYRIWDTSNQTISFHRDNLAMVRYNVRVEISTNGALNNLDLGLLMVWINENGSWKLLARQAFRVPQT